MIQKELAGKTGQSANVALLIFIIKIGGNHICNSVISSFPRNRSYHPSWACSLIFNIHSNVQWEEQLQNGVLQGSQIHPFSLPFWKYFMRKYAMENSQVKL